MSIAITASSRSHILPIVRGLVRAGWVPQAVPERGLLSRNGQLVELHSGQGDLRVRLFVYKVTGSSRGNPDERRIEITQTYPKGLQRARRYADVVLGFDEEHDIFVGVDPARIGHGGSTGNASSFFDIDGLGWNREDEILIRPRTTELLRGGLEFHAFVRPPRLAEYLYNFAAIHAGSYVGKGKYSGPAISLSNRIVESKFQVNSRLAANGVLKLLGPAQSIRKRGIGKSTITAFEKGDTRKLRRKKLSREEFEELQRRNVENGRLGEEFVLNHERRSLRAAGRHNLASRIRWVSEKSVCEGYDILSFHRNGDEKWIEVKSTVGSGRSFPMSDNEWKTACQTNEKYWIYRVIKVRSKPKIQDMLCDPKRLEAQGRLTKMAMGWRITFK